MLDHTREASRAAAGVWQPSAKQAIRHWQSKDAVTGREAHAQNHAPKGKSESRHAHLGAYHITLSHNSRRAIAPKGKSGSRHAHLGAEIDVEDKP